MKQFALIVVMAALAASCNNKSGTESSASSSGQDSMVNAQLARDSMEARNKALITADINAINANNHDLKSIFNGTSPDIVDYTDGSAGAPTKGLDSVEAFFKALVDAFPNYRVDSTTVLADGNQVAVYGQWSGTFKNPFMGMKPTGKSFKYWDVDLFTFDNSGQMVIHRNVFPGWVILQMVGAKMK